MARVVGIGKQSFEKIIKEKIFWSGCAYIGFERWESKKIGLY